MSEIRNRRLPISITWIRNKSRALNVVSSGAPLRICISKILFDIEEEEMDKKARARTKKKRKAS